MRKLLTLLTLTIAAALFAVGCSGQPSRNAPRDGRSTTTDVGQDDIVGLKMVRDALEKNAEYKDRVKAVEDSLAKSDEPSGKKDGGGEASEAECQLNDVALEQSAPMTSRFQITPKLFLLVITWRRR